LSLLDQERVVAMLIMNAPFRRRFFNADAGAPEEFGLTPAEFAALRRLDEARIAFLHQPFVVKRFEYLDPAFPHTLRILERHDPRTRAMYAESVVLEKDPAAEVANFHAWARARPVPDPERGLLECVCDLELLARRRPLAERSRGFRRTPGTRPAASGIHAIHDCLLDLPAIFAAWSATGAYPVPPPPGPVRLLVWNEDGRARFERLSPADERLLRACDGTRTLAELERELGAGAIDRIEAWLGEGLLSLTA
jgi:hypothetical protein